MKSLLRLFPFLIFCLITIVFFYKTFLHGLIPFPGDILISDYKPWQTYSYLGYNPGSYPNKAQYPDTIRQIYPWKTLVMNEMKKGQIPLWNPYNFSGSPLLANFQSAVFYPLNVFYFVLDQPFAWTLLVILQPLLSLLFTYLYLRSIGCSKLASISGAITYSFSLFSAVWIEYNTIGQVITWLPLALFSIEKFSGAKKLYWLLLLSISLACSLLAGHPQLALYLIIFVLIYSWFRAKRNIFLISLFFLLAIAMASVQIVPGLELIINSARSPHDFSFLFTKILIQPKQLLMLIIPNIFGNPATRTYWPSDTFVGKATYVGLIPLFFILSALRLKNPTVKFFSFVAIAILALMTANPLTFILYKLNIPFFSSSSPTLMSFLFTFSLAVITSKGIDNWSKEKHSPWKLLHRFLVVTAFFIATWIIFKLSSVHIVVAEKAIVYSFGISLITLVGFSIAVFRKEFLLFMLGLLVMLHTADLFMQFQKFNPFVPTSLVFPQTPIFSFLHDNIGINRFWGYGSANIEANFSAQYGIFSPNGYDPLYTKRYGEFIGSSYDGKIHSTFTTQTRSDAVTAPGFGEKDFPANNFRQRVLDALGVKYILDRAENGSTSITFPFNEFSEVYNRDNWKILENKNAASRIFLSSDYKVFQTNSEFEKEFFDDNFHPEKTILLEQVLPSPLEKMNAPDTLSVIIYDSSIIRAETKTDGNRLLFLSDTYYPGWNAYIDNAKTEIYRADYAFRAILIPKGEHKVEFRYEPSSLRLGLYISFIGILGFTGLTALSLRNSNEKLHRKS